MSLEANVNSIILDFRKPQTSQLVTALKVKIENMSKNSTCTEHSIVINHALSRTRYLGIFFNTQTFSLASYLNEKIKDYEDLLSKETSSLKKQDKINADHHEEMTRYFLLVSLIDTFNEMSAKKELEQDDLNYLDRLVRTNLFVNPEKPGRKDVIADWITKHLAEYPETSLKTPPEQPAP